MNAKEAQGIATKTNIEATDSQYTKIQKLIRESAARGEYDCRFYQKIILDVKLKLQDDGFSISEYDDQRDGYSALINWYKQ